MSAKEEDASMTIGDLSADTGLLEITCSGLMSSTDHDVSICSCHGDQVEYCRVADTVATIVEGQKESDELDGQDAVNSDNICSPVPESTKEIPPASPENRMETAGYSTEKPNEKHVSFRENISLFNDTSVNMSRLMSRLNDLNEKNESTLGSINYSYADSTRFYSLGVGNLHDLLGKEAMESDEEPVDEDEDGSMNSVNGVEINEDSVSFKTNKSCQEHPFLKPNGDLNTDRIHEQAIIIERNLKNNEISVEALVEALENSLTDRSEKDEEIEALKAEVRNLQEQLQQSGTSAERRSATPSVETESSQDEKSATEVEDLKLQVANLEKKLEIEKKYLETQTAERELERDDFQKTITELSTKIDDMRREKEHLDIIISNQKTEMEDYDVRLRDIVEMQSEAQARNERYEEELKSAVDKIQELRSIIRELEEQIDIATKNATDLKEQNQFLQENLEQMEKMKEDSPAVEEDENAIATDANTDLTDELHAQVDDLARRLERKLNDMDNFQWSTRPNSSCSNAVSVSNEDISVSRDLGYINKEQDCVDVVTLIADGLRKLDSQFESLVRFEEIIMKKLRDAELRLANSKKSQEEIESEKHALQEKVKNQILTISDLENRLDQLRFEPSPNTMTLSGLRTRVAALNNEVEEYKGQLQLKELELGDALEKLAGKDALLSKLQQMPAVDIAVPHVKKSNVGIQCAMQLRSSSTQTQESFKTPRISTSVAVQTVVASGVDNLEISSIQGVLPVTHSTPNEGSLVRTVARNLRKKNEIEARGGFGSQLNDHDRSPEVLRDPFVSRVTQSVLSDKIPRIPDLRDLESGILKKYESDYGDEPRGPQFGQLQDRAIERDARTGRNIPAGGITDNSLASSSASTTGAVVGTAGGDRSSSASTTGAVAGIAGGASSPALEIKSPESSEAGGADSGVVGAAGEAEGITPETNEGTAAVAPATEDVPEVPPPAATKKAMSNSSQTPPLALANLIDALDEEEKERLFEELRKAEGSGSMTRDEKDEEIAKLLSRIKELETVCSENKMKAAGENAGGNGGSCVIETTLDFDEAMKPVNAETRMNYVVTQPPTSVAKPCGNVDPRIISEITDIVARLGCDSSALLSMNEDQCTWVHQALTTLVQNNNPPPVSTSPPDIPSDPEDSRTYTYEMETSVDFQLSENGDLSVISAEGKIIPSESIAKVSSGAKPLDRSRSRSRSSRINSVDRSVGSEVLEPDVDPNSSSVPWEQLQKTQEGRLNEADARVEVEVLKTKLNMMQQALEQERENNAAVCSEQSPAFSRLNQMLVEERGKLEELQCFVEQQNMEIASLTQQIQDMEVVCSTVGKGDATGYAVGAPPTYQTPVGLQVTNRQMNLTFTRGFEGGGLPCGGETFSVDPSGNQTTDPSTGLSSVAQDYYNQTLDASGMPGTCTCIDGNEVCDCECDLADGKCCARHEGYLPLPIPPSWARGNDYMSVYTRPDYAAVARRINFDQYADETSPGGVGDVANGFTRLDTDGRAFCANQGNGSVEAVSHIQAESVLIPPPPPPTRFSSGFESEAVGGTYVTPVVQSQYCGNCSRASDYPDVTNYPPTNPFASPLRDGDNENLCARTSGTFVVDNDAYLSSGESPGMSVTANRPGANIVQSSTPVSPAPAGFCATFSIPGSCGSDNNDGPKDLGRAMSQKWYELYLRAKSYRKALAWQKKYLAVVIHGYKDLLGVSGAAFEHPDLLQKEVAITPSSVGLCDKPKGKTRFRIIGKAVLASVRMKYMVNRWTGKMHPRSTPDIQRRAAYAGSSRYASASSSSSSESDGSEMKNRRNCDKPRTVTFSAFSPPTKDSSKTSRSAPSRSTNTGVPVGGNQRGASSRINPTGHPSVINESRRNPVARSANSNNGNAPRSCVQEKQLSQYFERFQTLEKEIGNTISRVATGTSTIESQKAVQK